MGENNIGEARRMYKKRVGKFTQRDAAEYFGVSLGTYRNWEQGRTEMSMSQLNDIAEKYGVTIDYLLGRTSVSYSLVNLDSTLGDYERELVDIMRTITPEGKRQLMIYARGIASTYSKNNQAESA